MMTKEHIRAELGVSAATIANWVRVGLVPDYPDGVGYCPNTYDNILKHIKSTKKLQSRVNRTFNQDIQIVTGSLSYTESKLRVEWLASLLERYELDVPALMFTLSLKALSENDLIKYDWDSGSFESENPEFSAFLNAWGDEFDAEKTRQLYRDLSGLKIPEKEPDFMGVVYESMRTLGEKSRLGAFFTPSFLVEDLSIPSKATVLDPCSGTGTILLHVLSKEHAPALITLRDIDALAIKIAKVNFALYFNRVDELVQTALIDILQPQPEEHFDYIVTNPPWGARLDRKIKRQLLQEYPELNTGESFSIALYNGLKKLSNKGKLIYILPESLLYVDTHSQIRQLIFGGDYKVHLTHFGNAFKGVMSKVIRLEIALGAQELTVTRGKENYRISQTLLLENNFRPPAIENGTELAVVEKILSCRHFTLAGKCTFGLGIVTGNNKEHLHSPAKENSEPIYTGKELEPFQFKDPTNFINFDPSKLQQVAKLELYRQPKICYRFISDKIVVAVDFKKSLVLNSINFFVPDKEFSLKALCALLNAPIITFLYRRLFNSTKVLRSHLESLPIPDNFFDYEPGFKVLYNKAVKGEPYLDELHEHTCRMYGLNASETTIIKTYFSSYFYF